MSGSRAPTVTTIALLLCGLVAAPAGSVEGGGDGAYAARVVNAAFERLEQGNEGALKDYQSQMVAGLNALTSMVLGELSRGDRSKIKTLITIEVHARDIVSRLVADKVESASSFSWQSQLKYRG